MINQHREKNSFDIRTAYRVWWRAVKLILPYQHPAKRTRGYKTRTCSLFLGRVPSSSSVHALDVRYVHTGPGQPKRLYPVLPGSPKRACACMAPLVISLQSSPPAGCGPAVSSQQAPPTVGNRPRHLPRVPVCVSPRVAGEWGPEHVGPTWRWWLPARAAAAHVRHSAFASDPDATHRQN